MNDDRVLISKQINNVLSKEDIILTKVARVEKDMRLNIVTKFSRETGQLLPFTVNPVDYAIWGVLQERVYHRWARICYVNHLKERLILNNSNTLTRVSLTVATD